MTSDAWLSFRARAQRWLDRTVNPPERRTFCDGHYSGQPIAHVTAYDLPDGSIVIESVRFVDPVYNWRTDEALR